MSFTDKVLFGCAMLYTYIVIFIHRAVCCLETSFFVSPCNLSVALDDLNLFLYISHLISPSRCMFAFVYISEPWFSLHLC